MITLPETNIFASENGWLEYYFPFGFRPIFRGELLVSGSVVQYLRTIYDTNTYTQSIFDMYFHSSGLVTCLTPARDVRGGVFP